MSGSAVKRAAERPPVTAKGVQDSSNHRTTFRASKVLTNQATPKTVLPQAMLEHVDSVADNRKVQGSSGREDVLNLDRETRPTALSGRYRT